jgi:hypothetical protein
LEAIPIKRRIMELMSIPLIQGALQYAYTMRPGNQIAAGGSKEKAKGAAFSAAILPRIAACDGAAAKTIEENMDIRSHPYMSSGFTRVKEAFESTYACLGITCEDIGGILGTTVRGTTSYMVEPCVSTLSGQGVIQAPSPVSAPAAPPAPASVIYVSAPAPPATAQASSEDQELPLWATICIALSVAILCLCGGFLAWQLAARGAKPYRKFEDRFECCFCGNSPEACICGQRSVAPSVFGRPSGPEVNTNQHIQAGTPVVPMRNDNILVIDGGYSTDEEQPNSLAKL